MAASRDWATEPPDGFDWDPAKYAEALREHATRFEVAILVFDDPQRIEAFDDREPYGEDRFYAIGMALDRLVRVAFTLRGEHDEVTRIITAFKASSSDRRRYERSRKKR